MKKIELLAPAGNMKMFDSALNNGADAIYLAGKLYGARAYAENFSNEEIITAIKKAHLYGVKVYVTINTLLYEKEVLEFLEFVKFLYENNVDAVLMQDLGMINLVHALYPNLVIHASTQFHNHNKEQLQYLKEMGVKRAVLARELSLEEIKSLDVDIEKEVFVYGALCISYSGCCLASSCLLNRSGNRGECAGICRLPYKLIVDEQEIKTDGNYLLSPKELNTLENLREIIDSQIDSLKIEGRMKSSEYVGYVTHLFRRLIDAYYNQEEMNITKEELINLKKLYNRDFTLGHLFAEKNYKLLNIKTPNHQGYPLGTAYPSHNKIKIVLTDDIAQNDGIRFSNGEGMIINYLYDENNLLINSASKGNIIYVDNKVNLKESGVVLKTLDTKLNEKINDIPKRTVPVNILVYAKIGQPLKAIISDGNYEIAEEIGMVEKSINSPVLKKEIIARFSRLNETIFSLKDITIEADDNIFIPVKFMNELRRNLVAKLTEKRLLNNYEAIIKTYQPKIKEVTKTKSLIFYVQTEEQLKYLLNKKVNIYVNDLALYQKYHYPNVFYVIDRTAFHLKDFNNENIVSSDLSSIYKYQNNNKLFSDIYLNVTNSYTLEVLHNLGVEKVSLSIENSFEDNKNIIKEYYERNNTLPNTDVLVFGKVELMVLKHCFLNMFLNDKKTCSVCKEKKKYYFKNQKNNLFPLLNRNCHTYVLNYQNIDLIEKIKDYQELGINNFTINLLDETEEEIAKILLKINMC